MATQSINFGGLNVVKYNGSTMHTVKVNGATVYKAPAIYHITSGASIITWEITYVPAIISTSLAPSGSNGQLMWRKSDGKIYWRHHPGCGALSFSQSTAKQYTTGYTTGWFDITGSSCSGTTNVQLNGTPVSRADASFPATYSIGGVTWKLQN